MQSTMRGFIDSLTIFILYMVITSAMLVVPVVLEDDTDAEPVDAAASPPSADIAAPGQVHDVPRPQHPRAVGQ